MGKLKKVFTLIKTGFFEKIFAAYLISGAIMLLFSGKPEISINTVSGAGYVVATVMGLGLFVIFSVAERLLGLRLGALLTMSTVLFGCVVLLKNPGIYTFLAVAALYIIAIVHAMRRGENPLRENSWQKTKIAIAATVIFFTSIMLTIAYLRVRTYSAPNYDYGIFCHMFRNMRESFSPVTTCERDKLLSHFAVHFSPASYVLLPIYFIFPTPYTINICQILVIYSAIIPFLLLAKRMGFKGKTLLCLAIMFSTYSAFFGGCLYDYHENCLLVPFLMWMIYFLEAGKSVPYFIFLVLLLLVKEDAAIFAMLLGVFVILEKRDFKKGIPTVVLSLIYFIAVCLLMEKYGNGVMSYRYDTMHSQDEGLIGIIKTVLFNPGHTVNNIFASGDAEKKLIYIIQIFMPFAFLPFVPKKATRLLFVLPILLNLLTDYGYQYEIRFQYGFAMGVLLFYSVLLSLNETEDIKKQYLAKLCAGLSALMFVSIVSAPYSDNLSKFANKADEREKIDSVISTIDEDKRVCASTYFVPHLTNRDEIYEVYYHKYNNDVDVLVLDMRGGFLKDSVKQIEEYVQYGFECVLENDVIAVYEKKN